MQLIDILTNAIALSGAAYFLLALGVHLHYHWQNPRVELKRADQRLVESATPEASTDALTTPLPDGIDWDAEAADLAALIAPAAEVAEVAEVADLSGLTIRELKAVARQRQLKRYSNFTKAELIAALA